MILGAFGVAAASQGTMNNFLFGSSHFGFYETIGGGSGATKSHHGADAVHTHMTNTRLTDAEVIESRYPVRLTAFRIRRGSGGNGKHRGGDGIEREFEFLAPLSVSLISSRRGKFTPYGLDGGHPGTCGENWLLETGSEWKKLPGIAQFSVKNGDRLLIKTPGGGGFGLP